MLELKYSDLFLKDLQALKSTSIYKHIYSLCFEQMPALTNFHSVPHLKKMKGFKDYYRIRIGSYRIGIKIEGNQIILLRVLHRKDIYKRFP